VKAIGALGDSTLGEKRPRVVRLDERDATDPQLTGGKAAALAVAETRGLPTLGGAVLTTAFGEDVDGGSDLATHPAVREVFELVGGDEHALVARSSSVLEDTAASSMAGQFESVVGIEGYDAFVRAVRAVLDSRGPAGVAEAPIAVLVQPLIEPRFGGVMFGVDPVSGRSDRRVVTAVAGGPAALVSGEVDGSRHLVDESGRVLEHDLGDGAELPATAISQLLGLSSRVAEVFGSPQDVEWAIDHGDRLWLLQSRPVTTEVRGVPAGPIFGPGPVAETFPEPLRTLEADLWVPPLRAAVTEALLLAGAATPEQIRASEVVVVIDGNVAIDLQLTGEIRMKPPLWHRLNPIPGARRLRSAWRVGRLRGALSALAEDLLDRVDADLEAVPAIDSLTSRQLLALLTRGREVLKSLHAHEILMGLLMDTSESRMTGASVALRVLAEARHDGLDDAEIKKRSPVVLALTAPHIAPDTDLPADARPPDFAQQSRRSSDAAILREALRLRVRWLQEITGRAAWLLGLRLAKTGVLADPAQVRSFSLVELDAIITNRAVAVPTLLAFADGATRAARPLPACFQVSDRGRPVPVRRGSEKGGGTGAGGGVGTGRVTRDTADPPNGSVLVTTTLTPGLGPLLPRLSGIIAETGSVLAHLAILARESGVATVVGYADAAGEFPEGTSVTVNGDTGDVTVLDEEVAQS
jgi:pyruvate,water dikinase